MNYRNTRIHQRGIELVTLSQLTIDNLPRGLGYLANQLRRAASSIVLNFAEGCGKTSASERRRYFHTARASAYEVAAAFDVANALSVVSTEQHAAAQDLCDHLSAMLTRFGRQPG